MGLMGLMGALGVVMGMACGSNPGECRKSGNVECCRWVAVDQDCADQRQGWSCVGSNGNADPAKAVGLDCIFRNTPSWSGYCCF